MNVDSASDRIHKSFLAQATGEETFEQGLMMRWIDRMAQQDEYKFLDVQFFAVARALVLYDYPPKKFLDICVRQNGNIKFMLAVRPAETSPEANGTFSKTITFNNADYMVKHYKGTSKATIFREIAIQNALYLMLPRHVPLIRGWTDEYIFMNKVPGVTLQNHFDASQKLSKTQLVAIIDIFTHLAFLGIAQGDVTGRNLLIRSDTSQVVVIDFAADGSNSGGDSSVVQSDLLSVFKTYVSKAELSTAERDQLTAVNVSGSGGASELLLVLNEMRSVLVGNNDSEHGNDKNIATTANTDSVDHTETVVVEEADILSMFGAAK